MKTRVFTMIATMLFLTFCGLTSLPRFLENNARVAVGKTRRNIRSAAKLLRDFERRNGAIPAHVAPGGSLLRSAPVGLPWDAMFDATSDSGKARIGYWTGGKNAWVLYGRGPDEDLDFEAKDWAFAKEAKTEPRWLNLQYDPTNGTVSDGDILLASWQSDPEWPP